MRRTILGIAAATSLAACPATAEGGKVSADLAAKIDAAVTGDTTRLTGIFKDIHQNPELGFMEVRTSAIVAKNLESLGFR